MQWRSQTIRTHLASQGVQTHPSGLHTWLPLQTKDDGHCVASGMAERLRSLGVAAVSGSTFSTDRNPPEGPRLCLDGGPTRNDCGRALRAVVDALKRCQADNSTD
jgi:DNA-binding transcriptional MocR family regulator